MNNNVETVVAVIEPQMAQGEDALAVQVTGIELCARDITVTTDEQYQDAVDFGRMLKEKMSEVTTFFAPMKKAAHDAHKQVCDREKQMLAPLKSAESLLKKTIGDYVFQKEKERKEAEAEALRLAREEMEKKLNEAIEAEANGDEDYAKSALIDAEIADVASKTICVNDTEPKAKGCSTSKDWEITEIDINKVPDTIAGVLIRPVDEGAVIKLIRASKGTIQIDGINYKETVKVSLRR